MGRIVRPVFGKPCHDCGDQVPMARIRILEGDACAKGRHFIERDICCVDCQQLRENVIRRARRTERPEDIVTITRPRRR